MCGSAGATNTRKSKPWRGKSISAIFKTLLQKIMCRRQRLHTACRLHRGTVTPQPSLQKDKKAEISAVQKNSTTSEMRLHQPTDLIEELRNVMARAAGGLAKIRCLSRNNLDNSLQRIKIQHFFSFAREVRERPINTKQG